VRRPGKRCATCKRFSRSSPCRACVSRAKDQFFQEELRKPEGHEESWALYEQQPLEVKDADKLGVLDV
jgi:hypothetical protein